MSPRQDQTHNRMTTKPPTDVIELDGRLLAAARALANLTVRELAAEADTTRRVISDLEQATIRVADRRRHGFTSPELWSRIIAALGRRGVEIVAANNGHGAGARWLKP
ncbi:MAG: hypothetical protein ACKVP7_13955 [Hyphomicrobiaceae bacterium]